MFLSLITGAAGKYIMGGVILAMLLASAFGYVKLKEHEATQAALFNFNQQQLTLSIEQNKQYQIKIDQLTKISNDMIVKNSQLNSILDADTVSTVQFINNSKTTLGLDPLFNQTLARLKVKGVK